MEFTGVVPKMMIQHRTHIELYCSFRILLSLCSRIMKKHSKIAQQTTTNNKQKPHENTNIKNHRTTFSQKNNKQATQTSHTKKPQATHNKVLIQCCIYTSFLYLLQHSRLGLISLFHHVLEHLRERRLLLSTRALAATPPVVRITTLIAVVLVV